MNTVRVGSRGDSLVLQQDDVNESITLKLQSDRLSAATQPRDYYDLRGLADYLIDLADTALTGWSGTKDWESLEHDVQLRARCLAGHVTLTAWLRDARAEPANEGWTAQLDITLDPGEELRQAASDARYLLGSV